MAKNHKLLAFIADQNLNQTSFAKEVGVDRQTVISWINQKKEPSLSSLHAIATRFGVDPYQLNEDLNLGVQLTEAETALQKLQKEVSGLKEWIKLPEPCELEDKQAEATVNFILGALDAKNLSLLDVIAKTTLTSNDWIRFYSSGEISDEDLQDLLDWLELKIPGRSKKSGPGAKSTKSSNP
ncbi:MAG: helix-turn-helix domain-containing protein [Cyanobacteria bacterium P01_H01_bin.105]